MRTFRPATWATLMSLCLFGCASSPQGGPCTVRFSGSVCLDMSEAGGLVSYQNLVEREVGATLEAVRAVLPITDLRIVLVADPSGVIPEIGFGGSNPGAHEVRLFADPARPDVEAALASQLMPILAHEIHHAVRRRSVGYGSTLLQAAVTEGLADHFSLEVVPGAPPPWATALSAEELEVWTPEVTSRSSGSYDHAEWFFGTGPTVPRWTGYAVGFALVSEYLAANPQRRASDLVDEPAPTFVPGDPVQ